MIRITTVVAVLVLLATAAHAFDQGRCTPRSEFGALASTKGLTGRTT
jgi:hypothetical protein